MLNIVRKIPLHIKVVATAERNVSLSAIFAINQKWREDRGLPNNPNAFGPLTNMPDYTFMDGRPTPIGSNQKRRLIRQQEIAAKIVTLSKELNFAKDRHVRLKAEEEAKRNEIMVGKLKPKGPMLLKNE